MSIIETGLWPDDIRPSVQSPLAILQLFAKQLTDQTKNILVGHAFTSSEREGEAAVTENLDAVAPALNNLRYRMLSVRHKADFIYPAYVDAKYFERSPLEAVGKLSQASNLLFATNLLLNPGREKLENEAHSDEELIALLKKVVRAEPIKTSLVSLIAKSNEALEKSGNGETASEQE